MNDIYEKLFYIVIGAVIAKILDWYIQQRKVSRYQQAILEELDDIKERLKLICTSLERSLQVYALGGIAPDLPLKLSNPIYKKYYTEVAIRYGASQRKSFSLIDSFVDSMNEGINGLSLELPKTIDNISENGLENWGNLLKANYRNAAVAFWHVGYHLNNKDIPMLGGEGSGEHKQYLEYVDSIDEHIKKLIEGAKENLSRDNFE